MELYSVYVKNELPKSMSRFVIESSVVCFLIGLGMSLILTRTNPIKLLQLLLSY